VIEVSFWRRKSVRRALGVFFLSLAMLAGSVSSNSTLKATQDETSSESAAGSLVVPAGLSEEDIEGVDKEIAKAIGADIVTLFDSASPVDARKAAASKIRSTALAIQSTSPALDSLKRQLLRQGDLASALIKAAEVTNVSPGSVSPASQLREGVYEAESMLNAMTNGQGWVTYLHLAELKQNSPSPTLLEQVQKNLTAGDDLNNEQRAFLNRPALQSLKAAVETTIAAGLHLNDETAARNLRDKQVYTLVNALLAYEKQPIATDAETARSAWRILRSRFPATADVLRPVVNENYFNHNVHFTVSEDLLSRLISNYRTESGCIADCIMGAWVTGSQTTSVNVRADIRPSMTTANFDLQVNGNTQSNTKAQKSPATVWTNGNHYFWMNRSVSFDGRNVMATPATFQVDTNSQTVGLATKYDRIPIVRGIVRKIASQKIAESKPQSEALTASRLREAALPKFEAETNEQFSNGNMNLNNMLNSLERRGVAPDSISSRSSNTHIAVSSRTIGIARLGGSVQPPSALIATGAAAQIHESALNNSIDALGFQGREIPEKDFVNELEAALSDLLQRKINLTDGQPTPPADGEAEEPPTVFLFSKTDPIRVRFNNGQIILSLRMGIRQEGKEAIPEETVTIPISMTLENGKIVLDPKNIAVTGRPTRSVQIKRVLARRIVRKELSPTIDLQAAGDKTLPLTFTFIELADGWLTTELQ
jgi:hypothetical protein